MRPSQSSRQHTKSLLARDEHELSHDRDKETEDHDYESTTTTTDSDPPPHTPIGASTTSDCVEGLQVRGDDEVDVDDIESNDAHAAAAVVVGISDLTTPVKLLDRLSASGSPSMSSTSSDSRPGSSKAVVFPSLNGSCRQGSLSRLSISSSSEGMSAQTILARMVTRYLCRLERISAWVTKASQR
ncbi:hypothetical protein JVU11DRAFT_7565 [Chiua virens]|nr:hypothetical protein JVU11DRAFT_7565 [Chiua virens]